MRGTIRKQSELFRFSSNEQYKTSIQAAKAMDAKEIVSAAHGKAAASSPWTALKSTYCDTAQWVTDLRNNKQAIDCFSL